MLLPGVEDRTGLTSALALHVSMETHFCHMWLVPVFEPLSQTILNLQGIHCLML